MSAAIDNLVALRVLSMLVTPFTSTNAYRHGIIDANGNNLIKAKDLKTQEQKESYTYLHRLVFNLKRILAKLPGGDNKLKSMVAALFLIKENYNNRTIYVNEDKVAKVLSLVEDGIVFLEEQLIVEEFLMLEDGVGAGAVSGGAANVSMATDGPSKVSTDVPAIRKRKFGKFSVDKDTYGKLPTGVAKFRKVSSLLNPANESVRRIYEFVQHNPSAALKIQLDKESKYLKFIE